MKACSADGDSISCFRMHNPLLVGAIHEWPVYAGHAMHLLHRAVRPLAGDALIRPRFQLISLFLRGKPQR